MNDKEDLKLTFQSGVSLKLGDCIGILLFWASFLWSETFKDTIQLTIAIYWLRS